MIIIHAVININTLLTTMTILLNALITKSEVNQNFNFTPRNVFNASSNASWIDGRRRTLNTIGRLSRISEAL